MEMPVLVALLQTAFAAVVVFLVALVLVVGTISSITWVWLKIEEKWPTKTISEWRNLYRF